MKKVVCGAFGTIYYANILKNGRMSDKNRVKVTADALIAVAEHLRTKGEDRSGYAFDLDKRYILALYDPEKYILFQKYHDDDEVTE